MNSRFAPIACAALAIVFLAGCAPSGVTIPTWQHNVERYIKERGDGDPNVLRDVTIPGGRRGFASIGQADPGQSSDVSAVLLGHRTIDDKPWFIYLAAAHRQGCGQGNSTHRAFG